MRDEYIKLGISSDFSRKLSSPQNEPAVICDATPGNLAQIICSALD
jgi:hypothetical protein